MITLRKKKFTNMSELFVLSFWEVNLRASEQPAAPAVFKDDVVRGHSQFAVNSQPDTPLQECCVTFMGHAP